MFIKIHQTIQCPHASQLNKKYYQNIYATEQNKCSWLITVYEYDNKLKTSLLSNKTTEIQSNHITNKQIFLIYNILYFYSVIRMFEINLKRLIL